MSEKPSLLLRLVRRLGQNWVFALAVSSVTMLPVGFFIGEYSAYTDMRPSVGEYAATITELQQTLDVALGEIEVQRTRNEVDAHALEMLRQEMAAARERTAELEEGLGFYRSMLSADNGEGLYLHDPELVPGSAPDRVAYRFIVQQRAREFDRVEGELSVELRGLSGEKKASYPLAELSEDFDPGSATLNFRYFQSIEGELNVPEGFAPGELILVARSSKPKKTEIRKVYPWELQERLINVGE